MTIRRTILAVSALLALAPAPSAADTLETPVARADHLTSAGGWQAWSAPQPDGTHRLQLRRPDGIVSTPAIPAFRTPVDASLGTSFSTGTKELLAVYSRCEGTSTLRGCDVHSYSTSSGEERRVALAATRAFSEIAPSLSGGTYAFVRRGGARNGVHVITGRSGQRRVRRIISTVARETATNGTRVGYIAVAGGKGSVVVRRISGEGRPVVLTGQADGIPTSIQMTRYRAGFLLPGAGAPTRIFQTTRFAGSGGPYAATLTESRRTLPVGVTSASGGASVLFERYLAPDGVRRLDPAAF